ncbi:MAG TPA: class I SAM-dependent methyltransferase [Daejeonella sp.]|nr:class I SAM-dependent methyltransferase [Daejeonella sp.]
MKNDCCPVCHSGSSSTFYTFEEGYLVENCEDCAHYYSKFSETDSAKLYGEEDEVYRVVDNRKSAYSKIIEYEYAKVLKQIRKQYPPGSGILDFGSGKGVFLNLAAKFGYRAVGIETAAERARFAREKYGATVIQSEYSGGKIEGRQFDVITLFHVLEHLHRPKEILSSLIQDNLKDNGLLIVEVPNLYSWQAAIAKNRWMHLDIPRHISHFTPEKLQDLSRDLNLKIIRNEYLSFHLGILGMCQSLLSLFGYEQKIIKNLKQYDFKLMILLIFILPLAFVMELVAAAFKKGGIIRIYCLYSIPKG